MNIQRLIVGDIETNCYILSSAGELCVIDPGDEGEYIVDEIKRSGGTLKYIIDTHYHPDHVSANKLVQKNCGGEILIHHKEKDYIDFSPDRFLHEGDAIEFGGENLIVLHTSGHSEGSICLLHKDCIFTGDTVFLNGCGRADLLGGSTKDLEESLERLSKIIKPGMIVYPGHGELFQEEVIPL
jgi:glyoxylase-like metal-dependent hydrolase (beta-lactamase superfamily II)